MSFTKFIRKFKDIGLTGPFTRWYDKNTRETRLAEMQGYANEVFKHIKEGAFVLEVAPGPGYMSIELAKIGNFNITGMDISADMINICKKNAEQENVKITFLQGNVSIMPFEENTFDFIFCSAAFKNFKEPIAALKEMHRVLKTNGIVLIIDLRRDVTKHGLKEEVVKITKPGFERFWVSKTFKSLARYAYTKNEIIDMINQTSFVKNDIHESGIGLSIYLYK
jgi:ubiquinone/menaquinone biosynthesis C-methylase UbiE